MTAHVPESVSPRRYSASDIIELIQVFRDGGDLEPGELKGMERLGLLLKHLEYMTDEDLADMVRTHFRSV